MSKITTIEDGSLLEYSKDGDIVTGDNWDAVMELIKNAINNHAGAISSNKEEFSLIVQEKDWEDNNGDKVANIDISRFIPTTKNHVVKAKFFIFNNTSVPGYDNYEEIDIEYKFIPYFKTLNLISKIAIQCVCIFSIKEVSNA